MIFWQQWERSLRYSLACWHASKSKHDRLARLMPLLSIRSWGMSLTGGRKREGRRIRGKASEGGKKDVYVLEGGGEFEVFFRTADVFITFNQQNIPNPCAGHHPPTLWHERAPQLGQHFEGGPRNAAAMRRGRFGFWRVSTELTSRPWPRCCLPRESLHRSKRSFGQSRASLREEEGPGRTAADCVNRKTNSF